MFDLFACVDTSGGGVYDCDRFEFFDDFHRLRRFDGFAGGLFRLMVWRSFYDSDGLGGFDSLSGFHGFDRLDCVPGLDIIWWFEPFW